MGGPFSKACPHPPITRAPTCLGWQYRSAARPGASASCLGHYRVSPVDRSVHIAISIAAPCHPSPSKFTIQVHMRELGSQRVAWQVLLQGNASVVNAVPA